MIGRLSGSDVVAAAAIDPLGRVQQQLEQQRAARDVVRPRSGGAELAGPLLPRRHGAVQPRVDLARGGQVQRLGLATAVTPTRCREPGAVRKVPWTAWSVTSVSTSPSSRTASVTSWTRRTVPCTVSCAQGDAEFRQVPGAIANRIGTRPATPSTRRASSVHGSRPAPPRLSASTTRTVPDAGDVRGLEDVRARQVAPHGARGLGGGELEPAAVAGRRGSRRTWGRSRGRGSATSRSGRRGRRARRCGCRRSGRRSAGRRSRPGDRGRRRSTAAGSSSGAGIETFRSGRGRVRRCQSRPAPARPGSAGPVAILRPGDGVRRRDDAPARRSGRPPAGAVRPITRTCVPPDGGEDGNT